MATKKEAKKPTKPTLTTGKTGFIVLTDDNSWRDNGKPVYNVSGNDVHSTLEKAKACCGEDGDAVLEVTLVAIHKNQTTYVKQTDMKGLSFRD